MQTAENDFPDFLHTMRGRRLLHVGHKDADCDALGSAYAMSCILPGDVGFAQGLKTSAQDLADWLEFTPLVDPDPSAYEYTIIYDTNSPALLGLPLPSRYGLFDHHVPGGHRFSDFYSELIDGAEWCWVQPMESTCSVLADLFQAHAVPTTRKMQIALAAGLITDTAWLQLANSAALRRLASLLKPSGLYLEDVLDVIDNPRRRSTRRRAVLAALRTVAETTVADWSILATETDSHDHGFAVASALRRLGADICAVGFPKGEQAMVMLESSALLVEGSSFDITKALTAAGPALGAIDIWGTRMFGRIVAPMPVGALLDRCVALVASTMTEGTGSEQGRER